MNAERHKEKVKKGGATLWKAGAAQIPLSPSRLSLHPRPPKMRDCRRNRSRYKLRTVGNRANIWARAGHALLQIVWMRNVGWDLPDSSASCFGCAPGTPGPLFPQRTGSSSGDYITWGRGLRCPSAPRFQMPPPDVPLMLIDMSDRPPSALAPFEPVSRVDPSGAGDFEREYAHIRQVAQTSPPSMTPFIASSAQAPRCESHLLRRMLHNCSRERWPTLPTRSLTRTQPRHVRVGIFRQ